MIMKIFKNESIIRKLAFFQTIVIILLIALSLNFWNGIQDINESLEEIENKVKTITLNVDAINGSEGDIRSLSVKLYGLETEVEELDYEIWNRMNFIEDLLLTKSFSELENRIDSLETDINEIKGVSWLGSIDRSLSSLDKCIDRISDYLEDLDDNDSRNPNWNGSRYGC